MPYGLFRTSYSLRSVQNEHPLDVRFAPCRGGSLSHKTTLVQAHRGFRLLTLASYHTGGKPILKKSRKREVVF